MPRITKVYTRTGDDGTTGLGGGQRVPKDSLRIECFGTVDEVNSAVGLAVATGVVEPLRAPLARIQNELFHLGSDLCVLEEDKLKFKIPVIEQKHIDALEELMDTLTEELDPLENFVLPGGSIPAAHLHLARCICRRAERLAIALAREEPIGPCVVRYLNRLSDTLFVLSRYENKKSGVQDVLWNSRA